VAHLIAPTRLQDRADRVPRRREAKGEHLTNAITPRRTSSALAILISDAQHAIAPALKVYLQHARDIGRRRPDLADATVKAYARSGANSTVCLSSSRPAPRTTIFETPSSSMPRDKLLVFLTRCDSERALRLVPSSGR
jgi:hypothetical protein